MEVDKLFERIEVLVSLAKNLDKYKTVASLYDLIETDSDSPSEIKTKCLDKMYEFLQSQSSNPKYEKLSGDFIGKYDILKEVLLSHNEEYVRYLFNKNPVVIVIRETLQKYLKDGYITLDARKMLLDMGTSANLDERKILEIIEQFGLKIKNAKNEKRKTKAVGQIFTINGEKRINYKAIKRGSIREKIVKVRTNENKSVKCDVSSDAQWLRPDKCSFFLKREQEVRFIVNSALIQPGLNCAKGYARIKSEDGNELSFVFTVDLEEFGKEYKNFYLSFFVFISTLCAGSMYLLKNFLNSAIVFWGMCLFFKFCGKSLYRPIARRYVIHQKYRLSAVFGTVAICVLIGYSFYLNRTTNPAATELNPSPIKAEKQNAKQTSENTRSNIPATNTFASEQKSAHKAQRFSRKKSNVIVDSKTGLEWYVGSRKSLTWAEAWNLIRSLNIDGGDWRLPTIDELQTLMGSGSVRGMCANSTVEFHIDPIFSQGCWAVWSNEKKGSQSGYYFTFGRGSKDDVSLIDCQPNCPRVFAVRGLANSQ